MSVLLRGDLEKRSPNELSKLSTFPSSPFTDSGKYSCNDTLEFIVRSDLGKAVP